jgi:hypothetical protein
MPDKPAKKKPNEVPGCQELLSCYYAVAGKYGHQAARHALYILIVEVGLSSMK